MYFVELGDVVEVAEANGNFKSLVDLLTELDYVDILKGLSSQTIFAPSDAAFAKLAEGTLKNLTTKQKRSIVSRHIVEGKTILAADVESGPIETYYGLLPTRYLDLIKTDTGGVQISYKNNIINVVTPDVMASNGVIHVIDKLILPGKFPTFNSFLHFFH